MKKLSMLVTLLIAAAGIGLAGMRLGSAAYPATASPEQPLSHYVPGGAALFLQAKDFSSLLADWNRSPEKQAWLVSSNYEVFSRSRLLLRLRDAGKQFASAAGLPPDMDFLNQVAGEQECSSRSMTSENCSFCTSRACPRRTRCKASSGRHARSSRAAVPAEQRSICVAILSQAGRWRLRRAEIICSYRRAKI